MLTHEETRALAILAALVALGSVLGWVDARHPRFLALTLGDSLALGALSPVPEVDPAAVASAHSGDSSGSAVSDPRGPAPPDSSPGPVPGGGFALDGRLDLNRATAEELETLPGVGPKTAARIVEDRARRGRFRTAKDLGRVKGIGPKTLARLLPRVTVAAAPRAAGR